MRKTLNIFYLLVVFSFFVGCESVGSYKVVHQKYDSIEDPFTVDSLLFYKEPPFNSFYGEKITTQKTEYFTLKIVYDGSSWRFMEGDVIVEADGEIFKYTDNKPHRMTFSGGVRETITVMVPADEFSKIANSNNLRIQFYANPTTIDEKGRGFLKQFYEEFK